MFSILDEKPVCTLLTTYFKLSSQLRLSSNDEEFEYMSKVSHANATGCLMHLMDEL